MANAALRGLRRWVHSQMQPLYNQLPTDADNDREMEKEKEQDVAIEISSVGSSRSGSSGSGNRSPESPRTSHGEPRFGHGRTASSAHRPRTRLAAAVAAVMAVPLVLLRLVYLLWLLVTAPFRRILRLFVPSASTSTSTATATGASSWPDLYEQLEEFQLLVPSFLKPNAGGGPPKRMHPTAWLDGLRGVAAFLVVWHHASLLWFGWHVHKGYGSEPGERYLVQLPIVRLCISGPPHVAVFFIVSGFALSYKPLRLSHQGRVREADVAIGSSVFRRHTRLFLMPVAVSFVACMMTYLDLYGAKNWKGVALPSRRPPQAHSLSGQLDHWLRSVTQLTDPMSKSLRRGGTFMYDQNLWTLPVEFDCSLVLFLCHAAFNRFRPRVRMLFVAGMALFAILYIYWEAYLFLVGMLICDLHLELEGVGQTPRPAAATDATSTDNRNDGSTVAMGGRPSSARSLLVRIAMLPVKALRCLPRPSAAFFKRHRTALGVTAFVVGLYLLSIPEAGRGGGKTPGYITLSQWAPRFHRSKGKVDEWYLPLGATIIVVAIERTPALQRLFMHPLPQYLGFISFSMYVLHGTVLWTIGHWTVRKTVALTGSATDWQYGIGIAMCAVVVWFIIIVLSDLVARTVDKQAVSVGHYLYAKCVRPEPPQDVLPTRRE
ncbi:hard surface-induced protein [Sporothrix schenckii 1099-18]|uniref:Hard surface-induced protein n=1 Tax=Sporothrix schenckii 1099-18 TaxID=1397361 RepID=A0A0F2M7Z1_SPOSC|nr:hard surface-induced protein [Sporothrix schenckii 1099-18]KJR84296.1 hard surface-induced protein [Sporothrix schenckii 1099-18]